MSARLRQTAKNQAIRPSGIRLHSCAALRNASAGLLSLPQLTPYFQPTYFSSRRTKLQHLCFIILSYSERFLSSSKRSFRIFMLRFWRRKRSIIFYRIDFKHNTNIWTSLIFIFGDLCIKLSQISYKIFFYVIKTSCFLCKKNKRSHFRLLYKNLRFLVFT